MFSATRGQSLRLPLFIFSTLTLIVIIGLPVIAILLYALFPQLNEGSFAQPFANLLDGFNDPDLVEATLNSLLLAGGVTLTSALIAVPLGYLRAQMNTGIGRLWDALFLVPFLIPPYIGSLAWMQLLQRNGFVEQLLGFNLSSQLYSFPGLIVVMALHLFPLIYLSASKSFAVVGKRYAEVARIFGSSGWKLFWRIQLPLVVPALLASGLIIFVLSIEEFGTPEILGRRFGLEVMVTAIHAKFTDWPIDLSGAALLSLLLILIAFVVYQLQNRMAARFEAAIDSHAIDVEAVELAGLKQWLLQIPFILIGVVAVLMPVLSISASAFMKTISAGLSAGNFGWQNFVALFTDGSDSLDAIYTSLGLALAAALITSIVGMAVAFTLIRLRPRGRWLLDFLSILPNSIPGMAVAVGLILTWNLSLWPVTPYNTLWILLLAYLCLMLPYPIRMISSALKQLPESLDEAAYLSGASEVRVIVQILAPLLAPIAVSAGFIVFAISTRELVSSLMLAPPGVSTVATFVFSQFDQGSINEGMAMSILVILISGSIITLGQRLQGLSFNREKK